MKVFGLLISIGLLFTLTFNQVISCSLESFDHAKHSDCHDSGENQAEQSHCDENCLHSCCHLKAEGLKLLSFEEVKSFYVENNLNFLISQAPKNIATDIFRPPIS